MIADIVIISNISQNDGLRTLKEYNKRPCIIFGAGKSGKVVYRYLRKYLNIIGFADNNPKLYHIFLGG